MSIVELDCRINLIQSNANKLLQFDYQIQIYFFYKKHDLILSVLIL